MAAWRGQAKSTGMPPNQNVYKEEELNNLSVNIQQNDEAGNTKGGSITVQLTSCLAGLESAV